ncbi:homocysteine S-methyltransferase [Kitasatospora kifunensis]|uniref:S-methylmethionine-dependent homocysteine/selenocysteine methylase n=1 Tax=Kitasatospora kifunensis TaxID=58351 RepID=A0A7W7QXP7_KITKI|nr:homocysteine S-methyltransferase [Kitasatospora kifunensis]MBB4921745.1 S-methylmethionine-dependent homocysteine/selenocysteine methylase [Kitasatospora kifunensis]
MEDFGLALAAGPLVLDGGLSNQLAAAGHDLSDELWSARLLVDAPEALVAAHRAYYEAGADVVITASYQASFAGFARRGIGARAAQRLLASSVALARQAAESAAVAGGGTGGGTDSGTGGRRRWVAASVGPYGAVLADGSEYRGRYGLSVAELVRFHRPRLEALAAAAPDVLALETVPDTDEARALLAAVRGLGVPVWLSYTAAGGRTRAGQPLAQAFALAADVPEVVAVGVNCCAPGEVGEAVRLAARVTGKPVVAYPNSGEQWVAADRRWHGAARGPAADAPGWVADGARLVGGCCRVGPAQIAELAARLTGDREG